MDPQPPPVPAGQTAAVRIDINELASCLDKSSEDYEAFWTQLETRFKHLSIPDYIELAPSSLESSWEALRLFGLREDEDFLDLFAEVENQRAPQHLLDTIAQIYAWSSPLDVAEYFSTSIHKILNELIISSLYREGLVLTQQERITSSHLHPSESASEEDPARLELIYNLPLSRVVTHRGETKLLSGFADYSIWHGHDSTKNIQSLATNFLIVKVKRWNTVVSTTPELAAYMGIVHKHRVALKQDAVVYGLTSDGRYFHFHRIDNDGVFTDAKPLVWEWDAHRIFSIMSWLIRRAALLSPSTTPIKDPMQRSIVLESSGTPSQKVDCGFSQFNVYDQEELEEYDPLIAIRGRGSAERIRRIRQRLSAGVREG